MLQPKFLFLMLSLSICCNNITSAQSTAPAPSNKKTLIGAGLVAAGATALYYGYKVYTHITTEEFTPQDERLESTTGFYTLNGYANPASRCAAILAAILPGRTFVGNPTHILPIFGLSLDTYTDRKGLLAFSQRTDLTTKIAVGHSCGGADVINHLFKGTLPANIDGVILVAPFAHTNDIADSKTPSWAPSWTPSCIRTATSIILWKYAHNQPIENIEHASEQAKKTPVLIIACEGDLTVPNESTERLYMAMHEAGFNVTYKKFKNISGKWRPLVHDYAAQDNHTTIQDFVRTILPNSR